MEIPAHTSVPRYVRLRFVAGSMAVWILVVVVWALGVRLLPPVDVYPGILVGALILPVLGLLRWWERKIRRRWLPHQGHVAWCFRATLIAILMGVFLAGLFSIFGKKIPGLYESFRKGVITWREDYKGGDYPPAYGIEYAELLHPASFGRSSPGREYTSAKLRLHSRSHPERPGWVVRSKDLVLRKQGGNATQPWTGEGLMNVMLDLQGVDLSPGKQSRIAAELSPLCIAWAAGGPFDSYRSGRDVSIENSYSAFDYPPRWLAFGLAGIVLALVGTGTHFAAKATMGEEFIARD